MTHLDIHVIRIYLYFGEIHYGVSIYSGYDAVELQSSNDYIPEA